MSWNTADGRARLGAWRGTPARAAVRTRLLTVVLAVVSLTAAACGSTVQVGANGVLPSEAGQLAAVGGDGLTAPGGQTATTTQTGGGATGSAGGTVAAGGGGATTPGGGTAGQTATATTGGGTGGRTGGGGPARAAGGSIRLGFIVVKNGEAFVSGLGTEASFGNGRRQVQAVVDELNERGGIAGRKIEPFFGEYDAAAADQESSYLAACTKLVQDDNVFAILTPINVKESVVACAANARTPLVNASFNPGDSYLYRKFGDYFFSPSLLNLDNGARLMLNTLKGQGALGGSTKVGIMHLSDPQYDRVVSGTFVPLLEAWNVDYETAAITNYNAAQINNAQLQFSTAGVNLVMFVAPNGINQVLFMQQAEQQGYRPKYFTTDPDSTRFVSQNTPRAQARNIRGVGTLPISNVPASQYPSNRQEQACLKLMRERSGENTTNRLTSITATLYCELTWEFAAVAERAGAQLTVDTWRAAYPGVGRSYPPVSTFGIDFGTGRHDNATLYRLYGWKDSCGCLTYLGSPRRIPR